MRYVYRAADGETTERDVAEGERAPEQVIVPVLLRVAFSWDQSEDFTRPTGRVKVYDLVGPLR